jgi:hypothetical protein
MLNYQGVIKCYRDFCKQVGYDRTDISEKTLLHYIVVICGNRYWVCQRYVGQSKPSLSLLIELYTGHTTPFTERVNRWLSVATPMQKEAEIPLEVLHRTVSVVVLPHLDELAKVNARLISAA